MPPRGGPRLGNLACTCLGTMSTLISLMDMAGARSHTLNSSTSRTAAVRHGIVHALTADTPAAYQRVTTRGGWLTRHSSSRPARATGYNFFGVTASTLPRRAAPSPGEGPKAGVAPPLLIGPLCNNQYTTPRQRYQSMSRRPLLKPQHYTNLKHGSLSCMQ